MGKASKNRTTKWCQKVDFPNETYQRSTSYQPRWSLQLKNFKISKLSTTRRLFDLSSVNNRRQRVVIIIIIITTLCLLLFTDDRSKSLLVVLNFEILKFLS